MQKKTFASVFRFCSTEIEQHLQPLDMFPGLIHSIRSEEKGNKKERKDREEGRNRKE